MADSRILGDTAKMIGKAMAAKNANTELFN